jgi:hypothetical protein
MNSVNGLNWQLWVVGVCVALALGYTVWGAVRNVKRVHAGGAACGGCAGDACGSGAGCGGAAGQPGAAAATSEHPVHWLPPSVGLAGKRSSGSR